MTIGKRKWIAVGLGVVALALAVGAWYFGGTDALLAVALAAIVVGAAVVTYTVVQTERRLRQDLRREIQRNVAWSHTALQQRFDQTREELRRELRGQLRNELKREIKEGLKRESAELRNGVQGTLSRFEASVMAELERKLERPGEQAEALLRAVKAGYTRLELEQERQLAEPRSSPGWRSPDNGAPLQAFTR